MNMHLMVLSVSKDKVTFIIYFKVTKEDNDNNKLKCKLFDYLSFMIPCDFDDCKNMTEERFWSKHLFFIFS